MPKLPLCRVCLVGDIRMIRIRSTELQEKYELLAKNKLITEDDRPETICYICYSQLQRCCRFSDMALRSDKILEYLLNNGIERTQESVAKVKHENPYNLSVNELYILYIDGSQELISIDGTPELISIDGTPELRSIDGTPELRSLDGTQELISIDRTPELMSIDGTHELRSIYYTQELISVDGTPELISIDDTQKLISLDNSQELMSIDCTPKLIPIEVKPEIEIDVPEDDARNEKEEKISSGPNQPIKEEPIEYEERDFIKIEIDSQYNNNIKNSLESETSNTDGPVNVPTTMLLTQLKKYMVEKPHKETSVNTGKRNETVPQTSMDRTHNIPMKRMKLYNECEVCHKVFHKRHDIDIHMRLHKGVKPYACNTCDHRYYQMSQLNEHVRSEHSGFKKCICKICNRTYTHTSYLKRHMDMHANKEASNCEVCSMPFVNRLRLQRHMATHRQDKRYQCNDCNKTFKHKPSLQKHILSTHSNIKPYICYICKSSFYTNHDLEKHHVRIHIDLKYMCCNICRKSFQDNKALRVHVLERHTKKPFKCYLCEFRTAYSISLRNHLLRIHDK